MYSINEKLQKLCMFVHSTPAMLANSHHLFRWPLRCLIGTNIIGRQIFCNSPKNLLTRLWVQESRSSDADTAQPCTRIQQQGNMLHTYIYAFKDMVKIYINKYIDINICAAVATLISNMKLWFYRPPIRTQTISSENCKISTYGTVIPYLCVCYK